LAAAFSLALLVGAGAATAPASATPKPTAHVTPTGTWGTAKELPGLAALNKGGQGVADSVSCPSAGNCGAAGIYADGSDHVQVFVANQTKGTWGKAIEVPGIEALNVGGNTEFITLSCASPGNCSAGGEYSVHDGGSFQAFVVTETNGTWGKAIQVPGIAALSVADDAEVTALSCASPGNCSAAGHYGSGHGRAVFVANQTNGTWGKAIQIPGTQLTKCRVRGGRVRVVPRAWRVHRRRVLHRPRPHGAAVRRQREERHLGQGHRGPRHQDPQHRRERRDQRAVLRCGG